MRLQNEQANRYRVSMGDRKRDRIIAARDSDEAVEIAMGSRTLTRRLDSWSGDQTAWNFECAVRAGPARNNSTPFRNVRVYVSLES